MSMPLTLPTRFDGDIDELLAHLDDVGAACAEVHGGFLPVPPRPDAQAGCAPTRGPSEDRR